MRMRRRLWGPIVHVPLGGSTEGALPSRRRSQQRSCAAGGGEGTAHRDGSDGVSCARGGGRQVSSSAGGLLDSLRSVGDMMYGLGLGTRAATLGRKFRETSHEGKPWGLTVTEGGMVKC